MGRRRDVDARRRSGLMAIVAAGLAVAIYHFGGSSVRGRAFEARALEAAQFSTDPGFPLALVSVPTLLVAASGLGLCALVRGRVADALRVLSAIALANLFGQGLKGVLSHPLASELPHGSGTFPSGHAIAISSIVAGVLLTFPAALSVLAAIPGVVILSMSATHLLHFGWHRGSDVLGGIAIVLCVFGCVYMFGPQAATATRRRPMVLLSRLLRVVAFACGVIGGLPLIIHALDGGGESALGALTLMFVSFATMAVACIMSIRADH